MTTRYPGGLIRKTPPTITPPTNGEGGSAPGVWTLEQASYYTKQGTWPKPVVFRELWTWGYNNKGQLGTNNIITYSSPVQIGSLTNWKTLSNGVFPFHMGAIKTDGTLWMWGENNVGQLGRNDIVYRSSPVQIGALTNWSKISTGYTGNTIAVKTDGTIWAWGNNGDGQVGDNTTITRSSPVQIGALTNWSNAMTSQGHVIALKTDGTMWSWGAGGDGRLGRNNEINTSSPVQIGSDTNWAKIAITAFGCVATRTTGTMWSWGDNTYGQLGVNNRTAYSSPVQIGSLTTWSSPGYGYYLSSSIKTDGTLWFWGYNNTGMLGDGTVVNRSSPVQIGADTNWLQSCTSYRQSYGLKTTGSVWSWGYGPLGGLGQNSETSYSSPVQVGALSTWLTIAAGAYMAIATKTP